MIDFEQQVAEALTTEMARHAPAFHAIGGDFTPSERWVAEKLARLVAAAIRAGSREAVAYTGARELMDEATVWAEEAAIAALRNES